MDVWAEGGGASAPRAELIIHLQLPAAICILGERVRGDADLGYLWHSDACLTLEEANHRIEVLRMMGYRLSEERGGGVALNANPFLIKIGSV